MNSTLVKVALGVGSLIFAGFVTKKAIDHKKEKKVVRFQTKEEQKQEKQKKEKSEIHPRVRAQIMMAKASAKIAEYVLKNQDEITAATKVLTFGAAVLGFVRAGKKLVDDRKVAEQLNYISDRVDYVISHTEQPLEAYKCGRSHGWKDAAEDVLAKLLVAAKEKRPFGIVDNDYGDFYFNIEEIAM